MANEVALRLPGEIERVVIQGDLSRLTPEQKIAYNSTVCESLGLNHLTNPFQYLRLNGKEVLYATRSCTEQLRSTRKLSLQIVARDKVDDLYIVTARASMPDGRCDESTGAVSLKGLQGEALANALMKCETKAKRRVTLSICGLGYLDETEVDSIPGAEKIQAPKVALVTTKPQVTTSLPPAPSGAPTNNPWTYKIEGRDGNKKAGCYLFELGIKGLNAALEPGNPSKFTYEDIEHLRDAAMSPSEQLIREANQIVTERLASIRAAEANDDDLPTWVEEGVAVEELGGNDTTGSN